MAPLTLIDPAPWVGGNPETHERLSEHLSLKDGKRRSLAARLSAFGVQVFTNESILRLKHDKCDAAERRNLTIAKRVRFWEARERIAAGSESDIETQLCFDVAGKLGPLLVLGVLALCPLAFWFNSIVVKTLVFSIPLVTCALLFYTLLLPKYRFVNFSDEKKNRLRQEELEIRRQHAVIEWKLTSLREYMEAGGEVPDPVLALADEVLEHCDPHKQLHFRVEYTVDVGVQTAFERQSQERQERQRRKREADARAIALLNDPILWVVEDGEEYAIAVWDEEGMNNLVLGTPKSANA